MHKHTFRDVLREKCPARLEKSGVSFRPDDLVVHIRVGDAVEKDYAMKWVGIKSEAVIKAIKHAADKKTFQRAFLIFGKHLSQVQTESKSEKYILEVQQALKEVGIKDINVISNDPDTDLCIISFAPTLVYNSKSSFSYIGTILEDNTRSLIDAYEFVSPKTFTEKVLEFARKLTRNAVI